MVTHIELIRRYLDRMDRSQDDHDAVVHVLDMTADLYSRMSEQPIESADRWEDLAPKDAAEVGGRQFVRSFDSLSS